MVLLKGGRMGFVEVKRPGEKPRPLQESRHRMLRELGFKVYVLDSMEKIGGRAIVKISFPMGMVPILFKVTAFLSAAVSAIFSFFNSIFLFRISM